jgi:transcriptional regulator with XRE-family HTH domain
MYGLSKKQKLNFIIEKVLELEITSYEIGKKTKLSVSGIDKILSGIVKNPQEKTLNTILEYLESKVLGTSLSKELSTLNEPKEAYDLKNYTNEYICCLEERNELLIENIKLKKLLNENNIKF